MIPLIILDHLILQIFSLLLKSILNVVEDLSFTQLSLSGTPYPILFVLLYLFRHFCLGLRFIFFLQSFSLSLLGLIYWIFELEPASLSVGQCFHRKGGAYVFCCGH